MRRKIVFCVLALSLLLLAGCGGRQGQQGQASYIGAEAAKQAALDDSGLAASGVDSITADLSTRNGTDYYQIKMTSGGQSYEYDIDAVTGVIIESRKPLVSANAPEGSLVTDADTFNQTGQEQPSGPAQQPANPAGSAGITEADAKAAALTHAALTEDQVTFINSKLDYDDGRLVYEVEFYTADYKEYDYEIDASTGDIVSYDYEAEGYTPLPSDGTITADKAKELALQQVPGAAASDIVEFEIDYDDGRTEYEGKIIYDGMEYEFEIDGYSGAFRKWEAEKVSGLRALFH